MNQEIKKKWISALLSGEYNQGTSYLYIINQKKVKKHCVLGVLCDLAYQEGIVSRTEGEVSGIKFYADVFSASLPPEVREWSGINCFSELNIRTKNDKDIPFSDLVKIIEGF